jgi:hypothetical protein
MVQIRITAVRRGSAYLLQKGGQNGGGVPPRTLLVVWALRIRAVAAITIVKIFFFMECSSLDWIYRGHKSPATYEYHGEA